MSEQQLYELLGRKQAQLEQVSADYVKLIGVLRSIQEGECDPGRLRINPNGSWALLSAEPQPEAKPEAA